MFKIQFWRLRFGERGHAVCQRDNLRNIDLFISAVRQNWLMMVEQHVTWLREILVNLGMCTSYLVQNLTHMQQITAEYGSPSAIKAFNLVFNRALSTLAVNDPLSQELVKVQDQLIKKVVDKTYSSTPY